MEQDKLSTGQDSNMAPRPSIRADELQQLYSLDQDEDSLYSNQILDVVFESNPTEKLGFGIRIDTEKKMLQINNVNKGGQADRVGLKQNDIILAVNDANIGTNPQIGIDEIKKCKESTEAISITISICRQIFDHIMVKIQRSGIEKCNGKYYFNHLDEDYNSPVFMNEEKKMLLLKSDYDDDSGVSLWAIADEINTYYIGVSSNLMPPNDSWKKMKKVSKYPCPGLIFYNTQQSLVEIEEDDDDIDDNKNDNKNIKMDNDEEKEKSKIVSKAINNPESLNRHSRVFQTIHSQQLLIGTGLDIDKNDNYDQDKYGELLLKYGDAMTNVEILRGVVKDLNTSFYQYWLKDKIKTKKNEELSKIVFEQQLEIEKLKGNTLDVK